MWSVRANSWLQLPSTIHSLNSEITNRAAYSTTGMYADLIQAFVILWQGWVDKFIWVFCVDINIGEERVLSYLVVAWWYKRVTVMGTVVDSIPTRGNM